MTTAPSSQRSCYGLATFDSSQNLAPRRFTRRALHNDDIAVKILFCGVCHTDLHAVQANRAVDAFVIPGHEMVGEVTEVASDARKFKVGDLVAIGTITGSCGSCEHCAAKLEQYCRKFPTLTYGGVDPHDGSTTRGGYSNEYVLSEAFAYRVPAGLDPAKVAPLLCAGVTTYSPLRHWKVGPGMRVGVVGLGGLGHMAIKFARALGAHVVAFTTSPAKVEDAIKLGAHEAVLSTDKDQMAARAQTLDFIIDSVSSRHNLDPFLIALKLNGTLCCLGIPDQMDFTPVLVTMGRRSISSSGVAGSAETQEMLAFCATHNILPEIELIAASEINDGFARLERGDVRYRLVIDMSTLTQPQL